MQFETEASGTAPKCAVCRTTLTETPGSLGINYALHQLTQDLPVKCMSSGCTWSGVYSDASSHCSICGKLELKCENVHSRRDATACCHLFEERDPVPRLQEICDAGINGTSPFIVMFSCDDPLPPRLWDTVAKV